LADPIKYDYTMSPGQSKNPPEGTKVHLGLSISDIRRVDLVESTFDVVFFLSFRFQDHRLYFSEVDSGCPYLFIPRAHQQAEFWWPPAYAGKVASSQDVSPEYMTIRSLEVATDKHSEGSQTFNGVGAHGFNVRGGRAVAYTLNNDFNPRFFPFDRQLFKIKIYSNEPQHAIIFVPETRYKGGALNIAKSFTSGSLYCPHPDAINCTSIMVRTKMWGSGPFSELSIFFMLKRNWTGFFFCWIVPLNVIWLISLTTYWMDPEGNGGRDGVTITCFLASIFYQMHAQGNLPRVQYVTFIESYIFTYSCIIGWSCLVFSYVTNIFREDTEYDKISELDVDKHDLSEVAGLLSDNDALTQRSQEHQHDFDIGEQLQAVYVDKMCRRWVPVFTGGFNVGCVIWSLTEPLVYPTDAEKEFGADSWF
jgi:hypothetical protein